MQQERGGQGTCSTVHCKGGGHQSLSGLGLGGLRMRSTEKEQRERRKQNGAAVDSAGTRRDSACRCWCEIRIVLPQLNGGRNATCSGLLRLSCSHKYSRKS